MCDALIHLLANSPLVLLFLVAAIVLGYALGQTRNEIPNLGYAAVYPAATIAKLLFVQVLVAFR